jgi:hypothetical protein
LSFDIVLSSHGVELVYPLFSIYLFLYSPVSSVFGWSGSLGGVVTLSLSVRYMNEDLDARFTTTSFDWLFTMHNSDSYALQATKIYVPSRCIYNGSPRIPTRARSRSSRCRPNPHPRIPACTVPRSNFASRFHRDEYAKSNGPSTFQKHARNIEWHSIRPCNRVPVGTTDTRLR